LHYGAASRTSVASTGFAFRRWRTFASGIGETVLSEAIPFTDFPLDEIKFYVTNSTILLPSEY
jgi:hypothetical protein